MCSCPLFEQKYTRWDNSKLLVIHLIFINIKQKWATHIWRINGKAISGTILLSF